MLSKELLFANAKDLIQFQIYAYPPGVSYPYYFVVERGMTWRDFFEKGYNKEYLYTYISGNLEYTYLYRLSTNLNNDNSIISIESKYLSGNGNWYPASGSMILTAGDNGSGYVYIKDTIIPDNVYGFYVCYAIGTLITLYDGNTKKIEDVTYDDLLLVWDFDNRCFSSAKPSWISKAQLASYYYKITMSDGTELKLIGSNGDCHRLFNIDQSKFVYGSRFNLGEKVFKTDESTPSVVSIEKIEEDIVFYNMNTKFHINCFINGVLSSCRYNNLYPIKDMKFVKESRPIIPLSVYKDVPENYYNDLRLGEVDVNDFPIDETIDYVKKCIELKA